MKRCILHRSPFWGVSVSPSYESPSYPSNSDLRLPSELIWKRREREPAPACVSNPQATGGHQRRIGCILSRRIRVEESLIWNGRSPPTFGDIESSCKCSPHSSSRLIEKVFLNNFLFSTYAYQLLEPDWRYLIHIYYAQMQLLLHKSCFRDALWGFLYGSVLQVWKRISLRFSWARSLCT